jgi:hypothetical protein
MNQNYYDRLNGSGAQQVDLTMTDAAEKSTESFWMIRQSDLTTQEVHWLIQEDLIFNFKYVNLLAHFRLSNMLAALGIELRDYLVVSL